jgi:hypothetical protein
LYFNENCRLESFTDVSVKMSENCDQMYWKPQSFTNIKIAGLKASLMFGLNGNYDQI